MAEECLIFITSCAAGDAGAITACRLNTGTGALQSLQEYTDIENPFFLALSPDRKTLYSTYVPGDFESDPGYVAAFEIVGDSGEIKKRNEQLANGTTTCYVGVDSSGQAAVVANYTSGSVGSYPLQADGALGKMASFVQHEGASMVDPNRQQAAHAHCAVISPSGKSMYACDLGMDQVVGYGLDAGSATLTPLAQPYVRTIGGGGPRHFTYHPQGGYVYANNELANSVNVYRHDEGAGVLIELQVISTLPDDFCDTSYTADIKITPDGRFLYCSNRLHDSIAVYAIGGDGCLTLVEIAPSLGNFAQNIAITADGGLLLCANMGSDGKGENVVVFRIDAASGKLSAVGEPVEIVKPSCIMIV